MLINPLLESPYQYFKIIFDTHFSTKRNIIRLEPLDSLKKGSVEYEKAVATIDVFNINLDRYEATKHYMQIHVKMEFHQELYELAQKVVCNENDIQECYNKLDSKYKNLGYTAMIMAGNVDII